MLLRTLSLILTGLLLTTSPTRAEDRSPTQDAAEVLRQIESAPPRGLFYEAHKDGKTFYLFGTLHVGQPDFFPLEKRVVQAIAQSSALAVEIDISKSEAMQAAVMRYALLPTGTSLDSLLPPELRARMQAQLTTLGLPPEAVQPFKPWMAALTITLTAIQKSGYDGNYSSDGFLIGLAQGLSKPVLELESIDQQLGLFDAISPPRQIQFLDESLKPLESGELAGDTRKLVDAWLFSDAAGLEALARKHQQASPDWSDWLQQKLYVERNVNMVAQIEKMLAQGHIPFVAVGTLHLVGSDSIPALLQQRGYRILPLYPSRPAP